jgi:hypothetical protein
LWKDPFLVFSPVGSAPTHQPARRPAAPLSGLTSWRSHPKPGFRHSLEVDFLPGSSQLISNHTGCFMIIPNMYIYICLYIILYIYHIYI